MENNAKTESSKFYRFQLVQGELNSERKLDQTKTVGMAYMKEGQSTITMRLWTFVEDRFYLIQNKSDSSKYLVLTRELNKSINPKSKYFWNIVGNGQSDTHAGVIRLDFDLFSRPVYMNLFPEHSATGSALPDPVELDAAA